MKILLLSDRFLPHAGGSRVYYYNIYKRLASLCEDSVAVLTTHVPGSKEFDRRERHRSFDIIRRFEPVGNWKYHQIHKLVLPLLTALAEVRRLRADIVHAGDLYPQGLMALALKKLYGLPYVAYCHGEEVTQMDRQRFEPRMRDAIYRNADAVIAASSFARQNLVRIGVPEHRIVKITPGVDYERFTPGPRNRELVDRFALQDKVVILTVARLVRRKGHTAMLQAITRVARDFQNLAYLIVGTGPEEAALRALVHELDLETIVTFGGYVPDSELPDYYRTCDLMAMPNFEDSGDIEGFGMVFLEANAAGKPVLGGRSGGTEESILDELTGLLCDPYDVEDIARCLRSLVTNPELRDKMGRRGLERVRKEFNWDDRAVAVHALSTKVISGSLRHPDETRANEPAAL